MIKEDAIYYRKMLKKEVDYNIDNLSIKEVERFIFNWLDQVEMPDSKEQMQILFDVFVEDYPETGKIYRGIGLDKDKFDNGEVNDLSIASFSRDIYWPRELVYISSFNENMYALIFEVDAENGFAFDCFLLDAMNISKDDTIVDKIEEYIGEEEIIYPFILKDVRLIEKSLGYDGVEETA